MRWTAVALMTALALAGCGLRTSVAEQELSGRVEAISDDRSERAAGGTSSTPAPSATPLAAPTAQATVGAGTPASPALKSEPSDDRTAGDERPVDGADVLRGQSFASVTMRDASGIRPHALDVRVLLHFWSDQGRDRLRYNGGCYGRTALLRHTAGRFRLHGDGTAYSPACRWQEVMDQEVWLARLLDAGPRWRLTDDGHLILTAGRRSLTLAPHRWSAPWAGDAPEAGADLWDRTFASVRITEDGVTRAPADGARLLVNPYRHDGTGQLRYNGGCNTGGGPLRITDSRFVVGRRAGTAMMCSDDRMEQEAWFESFLDMDPRWRRGRDHMHLVLFNDRVRMVFEAHPWPPPWRADGLG